MTTPDNQRDSLTEADLLRLWIDSVETKCEELRAALDAANAALAERNAMLDDILTNLQRAATEFDDGSNAGRPLDHVVVDLLRDARERLAEREVTLQQIVELVEAYGAGVDVDMLPSAIRKALARGEKGQ